MAKENKNAVLTELQQAQKAAFIEMAGRNVNDKTEMKNGLTYLSWAWAWAEFKKIYPDASYNVKKDPATNLPYFADDRLGIMCYTEVTAGGLTYEMWLPVMDGANKAMRFEAYSYSVWNDKQKRFVDKTCNAASMFDVNKTIMRCLVKNLAMFGLGLYIYAGEDLPEALDEDGNPVAPAVKPAPVHQQAQPRPAQPVQQARPAAQPISQYIVEQRGQAFNLEVLNRINNLTDLLAYYNDHAREVSDNTDFVAAFTAAKQRIQNAA